MPIRSTIEFLADFNKASNSVDGFTKSSNKSLKSIQNSLSALKTVALGAVGFLAGRELINGLQTVTQAASIQEDAINNLNTALALSGEFSDDASRSFIEFAQGLQATTKFGDEVILQQATLAKSFGATNEQAKLITQASLELASATGKSLEEATRQVSKTLGGYAGELGEVNPAIKALTQEQLRAGKAAEILLKQYGGTAASQVNTFSGALAQLKNLQGDVNEEIGFAITQNPAIIAATQGLSEGFKLLSDAVKANQGAIAELIKGFIRFGVEISKNVLKATSFVVAGIGKLFEGLYKAIEVGASIADKVLGGFTNKFQILSLSAKRAGDSTEKNFEGFTGLLDKGADFAAELSKKIADVDVSTTKTTRSATRNFENLAGAVNKPAQAIENNLNSALDSFEKKAKQIETVTVSPAIQESPGAEKKAKEPIEDSGQDVYGIIVSGFEQGFNLLTDFFQGGFIERSLSFLTNVAELPAKFEGFATKLTDLAEAFVSAIPAAFDTIIKKFPEIGRVLLKAFNGFIDLLVSKGPELFKQLLDVAVQFVEVILDRLPDVIKIIPDLVRELANRLPILVRAILRALPAIIRAIAQAVPEIVRTVIGILPEIVQAFADNIAPIVLALTQGFVEAAPQIMFALVDELILKGGIFKIVGALIAALPDVVIAFVQGVFRGFANVLPDLFKSLGERLFQPFDGLFDAPDWLDNLKNLFDTPPFLKKLQDILDNFNPVKKLGGGGGVGDFLSNPGKAFGFATGGIVPKGFPNDTFPARLTSGEMVIPPGDVPRLSKFLDRMERGGGNSQPVVVQLQVSDKKLAEVLLNLNRQGFRTA